MQYLIDQILAMKVYNSALLLSTWRNDWQFEGIGVVGKNMSMLTCAAFVPYCCFETVHTVPIANNVQSLYVFEVSMLRHLDIEELLDMGRNHVGAYGKCFHSWQIFWLVMPMLLRKYLLMISTPFSVSWCSCTEEHLIRATLIAQGSSCLARIKGNWQHSSNRSSIARPVRVDICQGGYFPGEHLVLDPKMPIPAYCGWEDTDGWHPFWTSFSESAKMCQELIHCVCRCNKLACTDLCTCQGGCQMSKMVHNSDIISD